MSTEVRKFESSPHTFVMSRKTNQCQHRLSPDCDTNNDILFYAGFELARKNVKPIAILTLPFKIVIIGQTTEYDTDISRIGQNLQSILSRYVNAQQGLHGRVWDDEQFEYNALLNEIDLLEELANLSVAAVRAGLVDSRTPWSGLQHMPNQSSEPDFTVTRPSFSTRSKKPLTLDVRFYDSDIISDSPLTRDEFYSELEALVQVKLSELDDLFAQANQNVEYDASNATQSAALDANYADPEITQPEPVTPPTAPINTINPNASPEHAEPRPTQYIFVPPAPRPPVREIILPSDLNYQDFLEISPLHIHSRQRAHAFRSAYRAAFREWQAAEDKSTVNFPIGTYKMRVIHNLNCTAPY